MLKIRNLVMGCALSAALFSASALAQDGHWVSDSLTTFVRSGPTDGYRIVGTLTSGDPVTVLQTQGDYTQVRGPDGDEVWVQSQFIQDQPSAQQQLPALQKKVDQLTTRLDGIDDEWNQRVADMRNELKDRQAQVDELQATNNQLNQAYSQSESKMREMQARLDTQEEDLLMRYFMYGGGVAGAGLILGLIVPHLPRRRRKRDRWF
ncbi:SH3 domain-containing protein [Salinicola corii]|uniref:SH3 domain-containing protein n=1 Tax=Salinicola corii TaxID=2606937 RepID=A0A640WCV6_9GAMM|nr:SH3 domain-containing protein [Salinicola corii]MAM56956.1 peptide-binding protein [Salinicola sp.]NRB55753.1 SH3 domain-containing protein [Salinicola sp.]|tara:strand:- start:335 stop:952 length:618 start_codon:yes stop_codon:yes gene_type:complete